MIIVRDSRLDEFKRIEHLLYGFNYEVWFNLYGPGDSDSSLPQALRELISNDCEVSGVVPSTAAEAKIEIMERVLYRGDHGSGPIDLDSKKAEVVFLMNKVFSQINLQDADIVTEFGFKEGQPYDPVFWDFAYDIHARGERWILVGSSSD